MRAKVLIVLISVAFAFLSETLNLAGPEAFFLDLEQVLFSRKLTNSQSRWMTVSDLKKGKEQIPGDVFLEFLKKSALENPERVLLLLSEQEVALSQRQQQEFVSFLEAHPNFMVYTRWQNRTEFPYLPESRHVIFMTTLDNVTGGADGRMRRLVLAMEKERYDKSFLKFTEFAKIDLPTMDSFSGAFKYYDSKQVYIRYYAPETVQEIRLSENFAFSESLSNKFIFVGARDSFSVFTSISIQSRFSRGSSFTLQTHSADAIVMLNAYENLIRGDYIRSPPEWLQSLWIFIFIVIAFFGLLYLKPSYVLVGSFGLLGISFLASGLIYAIFSYRVDVARIWLGILIMQYVGIPYLLIKTTRRASGEKVKQAMELAEERMKSRILVKAVAADASFKNIAQVSHDIRSPLMALQIAHRVIKDSISQEAGELIQGSIERLKFIAEDTLTKFRKGTVVQEGDSEFDLNTVVQELVSTFKKLYPDVHIVVDIPKGMKLLWPPHSLGRSLTNLFNNSIEAFGQSSKGLVITLKAETTSASSVIRIEDNGPGISEEIRSRLFSAGATFGKKTGTGLGLYQVRKDLEVFGGVIRIIPSQLGACFELTLPRYLEHIPMKISQKVVVVSADEMPLNFPDSVIARRFESVPEAKEFLENESDRSQYTVFVDLVFPGQQDTAFDLVDSFANERPYKVIICTSLGDNEDIQKMSDKYKALLVTPTLLSRFEFYIEKV